MGGVELLFDTIICLETTLDYCLVLWDCVWCFRFWFLSHFFYSFNWESLNLFKVMGWLFWNIKDKKCNLLSYIRFWFLCKFEWLRWGNRWIFFLSHTRSGFKRRSHFSHSFLSIERIERERERGREKGRERNDLVSKVPLFHLFNLSAETLARIRRIQTIKWY